MAAWYRLDELVVVGDASGVGSYSSGVPDYSSAYWSSDDSGGKYVSAYKDTSGAADASEGYVV